MKICVGVLLRLGGESGWCFVLKSVGDRLCENGEPRCAQLEQKLSGERVLVEAGSATSPG